MFRLLFRSMLKQKPDAIIWVSADDDVRMDQQLPPAEVSVPHFDEPGLKERWAEEAYDRTTASLWGF